jgi:hypothetical protein
VTVTLGQHRPMRVRRIGARHVLVLPAQQAQLLSIDDIERTLETARAQERQLSDQLTRHRALIADLESQVKAFAALAIERDPDDPPVPQPPTPAPPRQPEPELVLADDLTPVDLPLGPVKSHRPRALHLPIVKA